MANGMATASYNEFQRRNAGPFCIVEVHPYTVVIDEGGVLNTVSVRRVVAAPWQGNYRTLKPELARRRDSSQTRSDEPCQQNDRVAEDVASEANPPMKYVGEKIVGIKGCGRRQQYIVRWYGYIFEDNPREPARKIPEHFIV